MVEFVYGLAVCSLPSVETIFRDKNNHINHISENIASSSSVTKYSKKYRNYFTFREYELNCMENLKLKT